MKKPLELELYPRAWDTTCSWNHHWTYEHPYATELVSQYTVEDMAKPKHLNMLECLCEYLNHLRYMEYWERHGTTTKHHQENQRRADILLRFATIQGEHE